MRPSGVDGGRVSIRLWRCAPRSRSVSRGEDRLDRIRGDPVRPSSGGGRAEQSAQGTLSVKSQMRYEDPSPVARAAVDDDFTSARDSPGCWSNTMVDERLLNSWAITETLLERARQALPEPSDPQRPEYITLLAEYQEYLEHNELGLAFDALEALGHLVPSRKGFWTDLVRAAENMGTADKLPALRTALSDAPD